MPFMWIPCESTQNKEKEISGLFTKRQKIQALTNCEFRAGKHQERNESIQRKSWHTTATLKNTAMKWSHTPILQ